jgi:hypothetical protein
MKRLGIGLIILSTVLYCGVFAAPFLPLTVKVKAVSIGVLAVSGEVTFWIGAALVGKELATKYRQYLNPRNWFKKKEKEESEEQG